MIGEKIRKDRLLQNMSLRELARKSGVSKSTLSDIENNKTNPTMTTLEKIADALEINMDFWFRNEDKVSETVERYTTTFINVPIVSDLQWDNHDISLNNTEGYLPTSKRFLNDNKEYFYIKMKDDSMSLEFQEGALLLVEKTTDIKNGDIGVLVTDDRGIIIRKIVKDSAKIILMPMSRDLTRIAELYQSDNKMKIIGKIKLAIKFY